MKEKTVRIVIETKAGFRFGYEKTERTIPEPKPVTHLPVPLLKGGRIDCYT